MPPPRERLPHLGFDLLKEVFMHLPDANQLVNNMLVNQEWKAAAELPAVWERVAVNLCKDSITTPHFAAMLVLEDVAAVGLAKYLPAHVNQPRRQQLGAASTGNKHRPCAIHTVKITGTVLLSALELELLAQLPNLRRLEFDCLRAGDPTLPGFGLPLNLQTLILTECHVTHSHIHSLSVLTQLQTLHFGNRAIPGISLPDIAAVTTLRDLQAKLSLESLSADRSQLCCLTNLVHLTALALPWSSLSSQGIPYLAELTQLRSLDIRGNRLSLTGVNLLSSLTNLTSLNLFFSIKVFSGDPLAATPDVWLAGLGHLTKLKRLNLGDNHLIPGTLKPLTSLKELEVLDVNKNHFSAADAAAVAQLIGLTQLHMNDTAAGLLGSDCLSSLTRLWHLQAVGPVVSEGSDVLVSSGLGSLRQLCIGSPALNTMSMRSLSALTNLASLMLEGRGLCEDGLRQLSVLTSLVELQLYLVDMGSVGVKYMSTLTKLTRLELSECQLGHQRKPTCRRTPGPRLAALASLPSLQVLTIDSDCLSPLMLLELGKLTGLRELSLTACELCNVRGLNHGPPLHQLSRIAGLRRLDLSGNSLNFTAVMGLAQLTQLESLWLKSTKVKSSYMQMLLMPRLKAMRVSRMLIEEEGFRSNMTVFMPGCRVYSV